VTAAGGITATGGVSASGGVTAAGGESTTGGATAAGGVAETGGLTATAGVTAKGGSTAAGGATGTGGATAKGGATTAGGSIATGGAPATGGVTATGGSTGVACHAPGTLMVVNSDMTAWLIDGVANPTLTFCRGSTYVFSVNAPGHPFYIKTASTTGIGDAFSTGVTGNGATAGDVTFAVPSSAPNTLFYHCSIHSPMGGTIDIVN
jgi:hypothetical protein